MVWEYVAGFAGASVLLVFPLLGYLTKRRDKQTDESRKHIHSLSKRVSECEIAGAGMREALNGLVREVERMRVDVAKADGKLDRLLER